MIYHDKLYSEFDANINSIRVFNSNEMKRYLTQYVTNYNDESTESLLLGNKLDIEELDSIKKVYKNTI